jgi:hypothetical protein
MMLRSPHLIFLLSPLPQNFDKLDFIFVDGDLPLRPWSPAASQVIFFVLFKTLSLSPNGPIPLQIIADQSESERETKREPERERERD